MFSVEVQGTQYEGRTDRIEYITQGQKIAVSREPENEYNSDNIAVLNKQGESLGNLSSNVCDALSPLLDSDLAEIKDAHVSFVTPLSKRRKNAKKAILYVELTVKLAETKLTEEEGSVVCLLGGDQVRTWEQKLEIVKTSIPFADAKALFELHNRYHEEYERIIEEEETDYGYVGLDNLVEEIKEAKAKMKEEMDEDLDYSVSLEEESFGEYIMEMAEEEPERYGHLTKYVDMMSVDDYFENRLDHIFKRYEVECNTYYWLDQTRVTEKEWDAETMDGFNHWYDVAELYSPEKELPFDLKDEDIVSIFGFGKFEAFADLSYGC